MTPERSRWGLATWCAAFLGAGASACDDSRSQQIAPSVEAGAAGNSSESPADGGAAGERTDPGGGAPSSGGTSEPLAILRDDHATTARDFGVAVRLLDNDELAGSHASAIIVETKPRHGTLSIQPEGIVHYRPDQGFTGADRFTYTCDGARASARVWIEVLDEEWLLVGSEPYEVWLGPSPDLREEPSAERWTFSDVADGQVFGSLETAAGPRAFALERGAAMTRFLAPAPSRAHHVSSDGALSGVVGGNGSSWAGAGLELNVPAWASEMELFASSASGLVLGRGKVAGALVPLLFRPDAGLETVPGVDDGSLFGLNDDGVLVGSVRSNELETAVRIDEAGLTILPLPGSVHSVAYDIDNQGTIVGSLRGLGQHDRGFVLTSAAPAEVVHVRGAVSTQLLGIGEQGELVGRFLGPLGYHIGFVATQRANALAAGATLLEPTDAANAGVAHACIHATEGPFRVLNAAAPNDVSKAFDEPHTMYTLRLVPGEVSRFQYSAPSAEQISFFVYPPAAVRLYDAQGAHVAPALIRPSTLCPRIDFVYQYQITSSGPHTLAVDPHPTDTVYVIFERSWSYPG
jgi:hypothetical protein